jgi:hypothetical protein
MVIAGGPAPPAELRSPKSECQPQIGERGPLVTEAVRFRFQLLRRVDIESVSSWLVQCLLSPSRFP